MELKKLQKLFVGYSKNKDNARFALVAIENRGGLKDVVLSHKDFQSCAVIFRNRNWDFEDGIYEDLSKYTADITKRLQKAPSGEKNWNLKAFESLVNSSVISAVNTTVNDFIQMMNIACITNTELAPAKEFRLDFSVVDFKLKLETQVPKTYQDKAEKISHLKSVEFSYPMVETKCHGNFGRMAQFQLKGLVDFLKSFKGNDLEINYISGVGIVFKLVKLDIEIIISNWSI